MAMYIRYRGLCLYGSSGGCIHLCDVQDYNWGILMACMYAYMHAVLNISRKLRRTRSHGHLYYVSPIPQAPSLRIEKIQGNYPANSQCSFNRAMGPGFVYIPDGRQSEKRWE